jgi:transmembrane sensor
MSDPRDLAQQIERAGARIESKLTDHDIERLMIAAGQRGRRRTVRRVALGAGAVAAAVLLIVVGRGRWPVVPPGGRAGVAEHAPAPAAAGPLRFADGSLATPLDAGSLLVLAEDSPGRMRVDVTRGRGRFEVTPNPSRAFSVGAGGVTVTVVGTVFVVERLGDRVGVTVERGTVKVAWRNGEHTLHAGEDGWFPLTPDAAAPDAADGKNAAATPVAADARRGDEVAHLLAAADAARAAGRADEGAALLRRVLDEHARDHRAPLAQFTLGRVLLMELGRPVEAARLFADLRARAPQGPFAEDALAREVEAWSRAGRPAEARARAQEYLRLHPDGTRKDAVRSFGGIP